MIQALAAQQKCTCKNNLTCTCNTWQNTQCVCFLLLDGSQNYTSGNCCGTTFYGILTDIPPIVQQTVLNHGRISFQTNIVSAPGRLL